jgi:hypothetical protein
MADSMYPKCNRCNQGVLLPVDLGKGNEKGVVYRCTNIKCNARFDEHGYSVFDPHTQSWDRITEG